MRWIFGVLSIFGLIVAGVVGDQAARDPACPEDRIPISVAGVSSAFKTALTDRIAMGYTLAAALVLSGLFGFLNSAQRVFAEVLHAGDIFPLVFAGMREPWAVSSLLNSRIVGRLGMRKVSHWALIGFIAFAGVHAVVAKTGHETLAELRPAAGRHDVLLRPGDVELRRDAPWSRWVTARRRGRLDPGLHHHDRRAPCSAHDRTALRRHHHPADPGLSSATAWRPCSPCWPPRRASCSRPVTRLA
ncbi:hypothetical protein ACRAWD_07900 [Caulobacter segnis]